MLNCVRPFESIFKNEIREFNYPMIQKTIEDNKSVKKTQSMLCCNKKCMFMLIKQDGSTTLSHQEMIQQIKEFYTTLYSDNVKCHP